MQDRNANGRSRRLTVARYGGFTPEKARSDAWQLLATAARGHDPAESRQAERQAMTVAEL